VDTTVVACCQLTPVLGDPAANRELTADAITYAAGRGAGVVVLPELVSSGYVFRSRAEPEASAETADGPTLALWARLAARHEIVIVGGFCEIAGGVLFNSAALVDPGGLRLVYRKAHLWDAESRWFSPGSMPPPVVPTRFGRIAVMICYDLEFPEWVRLAALGGADLIAAPVNWAASCSPAPPGERSGEVIAAQAAAASNGVFIAVADRCGSERGVDWLGGSVIIRRGGYPAAGPLCEDRAVVLTATIDLPLARDKRIGELNDLFTDRRPDLYARLWHTAD
jgi:5-aminopentanamidase